MTDEHEKNPENIARGLKAAMHNPNVSAGAKYHAAQQLEEIKNAQKSSNEEHLRRQLGKKNNYWSGISQEPNFLQAGYKSTLSSEWIYSSRLILFLS